MSNTGRLRIWLDGSERWKLRSQFVNKAGYIQVLYRASPDQSKGKKSLRIHRLVAEVFHPNPENKREVNHKDGVKANNRADNLEWATRSENRAHAIKSGLWSIPNPARCGRRLTEDEARVIFALRAEGKTNRQIGELVGKHRSSVSLILNSRKWSHLGLAKAS